MPYSYRPPEWYEFLREVRLPDVVDADTAQLVIRRTYRRADFPFVPDAAATDSGEPLGLFLDLPTQKGATLSGLTKRDYEAIAACFMLSRGRLLDELPLTEAKGAISALDDVALRLAVSFGRGSETFNRDRFLAACKGQDHPDA